MIVITGASDGLGKELATLMVNSGKRVIGLSRSACGEGVEHIVTDLTSEMDIEQAANKIKVDSEPLEALINCAGVLSIEKVESLTSKEVDRVLATNIRAPLLLTSRLMDKIKRDGADIVNVASTVGLKGYVDQSAYGASKWAMRGFSSNLQTELKDYPSRVISFCTGGFNSKIFQKATRQSNQDFTFWMKAEDVALCLKQLLELPKNMQITEIIIDRKQGRNET